MQIIIKLLNQNWVGVLVGIIGLVTAYFFYRRSLIRPRLVFRSNTVHVVGKNPRFPSKLKIFYGSKEVPKVVKTSVVLWNDGNTTLSTNQITASDPLRIEIHGESELLDVDVSRVSREVNAFTANISPNSPSTIDISFDYLDPKDGALIRILHTKEVDFNVKGTLRGLPSGVINLGTHNEPSYLELFLYVLPPTFGLGAILALLLWSLDLLNNIVAVVLGVIIFLGFDAFLTLRRLMPKIPNKIMKWYENIEDE